MELKIQLHSKTKIVYQLLSKNLDQGFPGDLNSECTFEVKNKSLFIKYQYKSNQLTHVSLTNHSYWNLNKNKKLINSFFFNDVIISFEGAINIKIEKYNQPDGYNRNKVSNRIVVTFKKKLLTRIFQLNN